MDEARSRVLWLGAGSSYAVTRGQLPLTCKLLDQVTEFGFPNLHRFMKSLGADGENAEALLMELDALTDVPVRNARRAVRGAHFDPEMVKRELHRYFIRRLCGGVWDSPNWAADLILNVGIHATIITTNYDNIAERILSNYDAHSHSGLTHAPSCPHCKMCLLLKLDCSCGSTVEAPDYLWRGSLLKLHGSISWRKCSSGHCNGADCLIADAKCRPFDDHVCSCCGGHCEPVLVIPSLQSKYLKFRRIDVMWDAAYRALADADDLIVFGFSFPESDLVIRSFLRRALASNAKLRRVWIIDVYPQDVWARLKSLLPNPDAIDLELLPVSSTFEIPEWWAEEVKPLANLEPASDD